MTEHASRILAAIDSGDAAAALKEAESSSTEAEKPDAS
jgi:hypothetical protein